MRKFFDYVRSRPLAAVSLIIIGLMYFIMIFADFFASYPANMSFEKNTFHPANIQFTKSGFKVREFRTINMSEWKYVRVKDSECVHELKFFAKGFEYKLFGFIRCNRHLFGVKMNAESDSDLYPVYILGADNLGRDLYSRIIFGSRISLTIGFAATGISLVLAVLLGGIAGYFSGVWDWFIMRFAEFFMLIPALYFILFLRSLLNTKMDSGSSYMIITLILALVGWPGFARTIRGLVHSIKREEFVINAALEGLPPLYILFKHIIPQITSLLIVSTALSVPGFIMSETTLSYLGLGINDPAVSWGSLINRDISTLSNLKHFPWLLFPVLMLLLITLSFNFFADVLRDFFDPYHTMPVGNSIFKIFKQIISFKKTEITDKKKSVYKNFAIDDDYERSAEEKESENENLLCIKNLYVNFSTVRGKKKVLIHAVRGVSFSVKKAEILGIVGESGSGKSVTTSAIPGLLPANSYYNGKIFFEGVELTSLSQKELRLYRGSKIALIFQEPGRTFDPLQSIGAAFWEALKCKNSDISKEEAYSTAEKLLAETGIPDSKDRLSAYPHQFSGGQLQRIGIALALAQDCKLLIADEPTTALDVTIQAQIISLLLRLKREKGLSIIFISHDINLVAQISDRIAVMYGGKIMEMGTAKKILNSPCHPYTQALISAMPKFGFHYTEEKLNTIGGKVCDPTEFIKGCPFLPRCSFAKNECTENRVCWKYSENKYIQI